MANLITQAYRPLAMALGLFLGSTAIGAQPAPVSVATAARPAMVTIDFSHSRGTLLRTERINNLTGPDAPWTQLLAQDVPFMNAQGLHGSIYRVWINDNPYDVATGKYDFAQVAGYLDQASELSDSLLVVMNPRKLVEAGKTPADIKAVMTVMIRELKQRWPKIKYIEAFNEPDHGMREVLTPDRLYDYYKPYYQAVNEVNRELKPAVPLLVGGPATGTCGSPWAPPGPNNLQWIPKFLDAYAADPDPAKRLDFLSYHAYGYFKNQSNCSDYVPIRLDPSQLAGQRARTDEELRKRGLDVNIPSFITETGGYPGPSYDNKQDARPDYLRQAAIMASYMYWYLENPKDIPFNWVLRHRTEERKDQLMTRAGADGKTPLARTFTPYGNQMLMFSKLKEERVEAHSNALEAGKGVYALATRDKTGAAVMVWNYQQAGTGSYRVTIDMGQLPATLRGKRLRQRMFRIDDTVSNYWGNPATANLQQVAETKVEPRQRHSVTVELSPNALQLVMLEPVIGK